MSKEEFMDRAIELARLNVENGGGPFGAVIVKDNMIVAEAGNMVSKNNDPTAHAEIVAIRAASAKLNTFDLSECEIYASCEPCPMCLGAIYWSHIKNVYYASDRYGAQNAGFDDNFIYEELSKKPEERSIKMKKLSTVNAGSEFRDWLENPGKIEY